MNQDLTGDYIRLKHFCTSKEITIKHPTEGEKIFGSYLSDKGFIYRIFKEIKKLYTQKRNNPLNKR
jgi:hypothetical protein